MLNFFSNYLMTYKHENGSIVAQHIPCQLDTVNLPWNMEDRGLIPTDWYDLYNNGWFIAVPVRGDYFVDEASGAKYQVFSTIFAGVGTIQLRVTKYSGVTP